MSGGLVSQVFEEFTPHNYGAQHRGGRRGHSAGRWGVQQITPESRVIEVTKDDGAVVWELLPPRNHGIYRAERLDTLANVRAITP